MSLSFLGFAFFFFTVGVSGEDNGYLNTGEHYVILYPPDKLTVYFVGPTNIVIGWDPPPVYTAHDVGNGSFLDTFKPGNDLSVTKHEIALIAVKSNETDIEGNGNATEESNSTTSHRNGTNADSTSGITTDTDITTPAAISEQYKCRPFSYFSNYTVAIKKDLDVNDTSMVVSLKESTLSREKQNVTVTSDLTIVSYEEGCILHHKVSWKEKGKTSGNTRNVTATLRMFNITGLKPDQAYEVSVTTVFVNGEEKTAKKPVFVTTVGDKEKKLCKCDWPGTINVGECELKSSGSYCQCKPGYEGFFCETCSKGYYRISPHHPCHRCPCDAHATRKTSCGFYESFLKCDECEVGYTGNICHMCAPGFYRYKHHCVMCQCNGNTPAGAENMCLPTTGMCINCQHNTTGFHCERCLQGYVGDAINFKNCTLKADLPHQLKKSSNSSFSPGIIVAIVGALLLAISVVGFLFVRRYRFKERRRAFWTVELKRDHDDVDFNAVGNDDAHMDDVDDMDFYDKQNKTSSANKYSRLDEQI